MKALGHQRKAKALPPAEPVNECPQCTTPTRCGRSGDGKRGPRCVGRSDGKDDCDCLNRCGDDPWLAKGKAVPCDAYARLHGSLTTGSPAACSRPAFQGSTMDEKKFKFELGATLALTTSGETGTVQGRAEYTNAENNYYLRYQAADGRAMQEWWPESALRAA